MLKSFVCLNINNIKRRAAWLYGMFNNPLWFPRFLNTQEHGFHLIKKQTVAAVMTSAFVGFLPFYIYLFPLRDWSFTFYKYHLVYLVGLIYSICLWFYYIIRESEMGFHGLHVLIGTIFLSVCLVEHFYYRVLVDQHLALECAIWYWHFVDVVWLSLFFLIHFLVV